MAKEFLIWACSIVFAATSIIALLGIVNLIKLEAGVQKKLFNVVIVEVATTVVVFFGAYLKQDSTDFVKITNPMIATTSFSMQTNQNFPAMAFAGACLLAEGHTLKIDVSNNGNVIKSENVKVENRLFTYNLSNALYKPGDHLVFKASVADKKKALQVDSVVVNIVQ